MELPINQIIVGDCIEVMKGWPANCVDLVLTDPPYGIGEKWVGGFSKSHGWGNQKQEQATRNVWDAKTPIKEAFLAIGIKAHRQIIWGGNYFDLPPSRCWLVWNKPERGFTLAEAELAWTNMDKLTRVCDLPRHEPDRRHPTQKPLRLMLWCLEKYSKPNDLILDPFCGSGTTCVAAKKLGRKYIGIDISPEYCQIARERLEAADTGVPPQETRKGQIAMFA